MKYERKKFRAVTKQERLGRDSGSSWRVIDLDSQRNGLNYSLVFSIHEGQERLHQHPGFPDPYALKMSADV